RWATVGGVAVAVMTALIASGFANISNYLQTLFSFFNVPLFSAFIIGMFWKRATRSAGFWGVRVGPSAACAAGGVAMVIASLREQPKTDAELHGLVYGMEIRDASETERRPWYKSVVALGMGVLVINLILYIIVSVL